MSNTYTTPALEERLKKEVLFVAQSTRFAASSNEPTIMSSDSFDALFMSNVIVV